MKKFFAWRRNWPRARTSATDRLLCLRPGSRVSWGIGWTGSSTDAGETANDGFVGVKKAQSGGTLAYNASSTEWVVRGGNVTSTLGGVANDVLVSAASDRNGATITDYVNENLKVSRNGLYSDREFDVLAAPSTAMVPGRVKGTGAGTTVTLSTDDAAVPTRAVPGELTYHFGAGTGAVTDEYKARDAFEDATDASS